MPELQPSEATKRAFGVRLRDLRLDAGIEVAQDFAILTGFSASKISRAENGRTSLSEKDIRTWAIACDAEGLIPELIAARREVVQMWTEYRHELKAGQKEIQARALSVYQSTGLVRIYESLHVPGILQTFAYARAQRLIWANLHGLTNEDVDDAAGNRLTSQFLVTEGGGPTFSFILEATALYNVIVNPNVMSEQYDLLIRAAARPHVALGVIPLDTPRSLFPGEGFYLFDEQFVAQEFWSGKLRTAQAADMSYFSQVFAVLRKHAVYGAAARAEIESARRFMQRRARN